MTENMTEKRCDLSNWFANVGGIWMMTGNDGTTLPILYCPFCGERIEYGKDKE